MVWLFAYCIVRINTKNVKANALLVHLTPNQASKFMFSDEAKRIADEDDFGVLGLHPNQVNISRPF